MSQASRSSAAANVVGKAGSGAVGAVLFWLAAQLGVQLSPEIVALIAAIGFVGRVTSALIHQRYAAILARQGPHARAAYDALRLSLTEGGLAARTYAGRLSMALDAVDRFFGDASMADRTLFPRAFGLRTPAPLWTAPAFDRCLLLALFYPIATISVIWAVSGHVGPAEHALGLGVGVSGWWRASLMVTIGVSGYCAMRAGRITGWRAFVWLVPALTVAFAAVIIVGAGAGAVASAAVVAVTVTGAGAGVVAVAFAITCAVAVAVVFAGAFAGVVTVAFAVAFAAAAAVSIAVTHLNERATHSRWQGLFQIGLLSVLTTICIAAAETSAGQPGWRGFAPLLLFLGLLTLINAPFDWASLGLTRALLRRGLELGGWWPFVLGLADAVAAAGVITVLTVICVVSVQVFDAAAVHSGGPNARILPLDRLFDGIEANPGAPEYWWVYALLLSTMIPNLVNMMIGGASLVRGIPWITTLLLRNMPERCAPPAFERAWMTLLLTSQVFLGGLLGIAAQVFLAYVVIGIVLPWFGLDLVDLARAVAALNLPERVMG